MLLALLTFPLGFMLYLGVYVAVEEDFGYQQLYSNGAAGLATWAFVAAYWWWVWRRSFRWTPRRVRQSFIAAAVALATGLALGGIAYWGDDDVGAFVGTAVIPLTWLTLVTVAWGETDEERAARLGKLPADSVVCPRCGYSLTGLTDARCPECGSRYTLSELLASQPGREVDRLR
jgi:hypothetical protein